MKQFHKVIVNIWFNLYLLEANQSNMLSWISMRFT